MDYSRVCYRRGCIFYRGQNVETSIRWYWAKPGASEYEGPHVFQSLRGMQQLDNTTEPGEITTSRPRIYKGDPPHAGLDGTHSEGTPEDFMGEGIPPESVLIPGGALPDDVPCAILPAEGILGGSVQFWTTYTATEGAVSCSTNFWQLYTAVEGVAGGFYRVPLYTALAGITAAVVPIPIYTAYEGVLEDYTEGPGFPQYTATSALLASAYYPGSSPTFPVFTAVEGILACPPRYATLKFLARYVVASPPITPPIHPLAPLSLHVALAAVDPSITTHRGLIRFEVHAAARPLSMSGVRCPLAFRFNTAAITQPTPQLARGVRAHMRLLSQPRDVYAGRTPLAFDVSARGAANNVDAGTARARVKIDLRARSVLVGAGFAPLGVDLRALATPRHVTAGGAPVSVELKPLAPLRGRGGFLAPLGFRFHITEVTQPPPASASGVAFDVRALATPAAVRAGGAPIRFELHASASPGDVGGGGALARVELHAAATPAGVGAGNALARVELQALAAAHNVYAGRAALRVELHASATPAAVRAGNALARVELHAAATPHALAGGKALVRVGMRALSIFVSEGGAFSRLRFELRALGTPRNFTAAIDPLRVKLETSEPLYVDLKRGITGFWPCHENFGVDRADASGHGLTLTKNNTDAVTGLIGQAAYPGHLSSGGLTRTPRVWTSGDVTFSCWGKMLSAGASGTAIGPLNSASPYLKWTAANSLQSVGFGALVQANIGAYTNVWVHAVVVYRAGTIELYANGKLVATGFHAGQVSVATGFAVGCQLAGTGMFGGALQLVGCWSRALSGNPTTIGAPAWGEIAALYNQGAGLDWPFTAIAKKLLVRVRNEVLARPAAVVAGNSLARVELHAAATPHALAGGKAIARVELHAAATPHALAGARATLRVELHCSARPAAVHAGKTPVRVELRLKASTPIIHGPKAAGKIHVRGLGTPRAVRGGKQLARVELRPKYRGGAIGAGSAKVRFELRAPVPWYSLDYSPAFLPDVRLWVNGDTGTLQTGNEGGIQTMSVFAGVATINTTMPHGMHAGSTVFLTANVHIPTGLYNVTSAPAPSNFTVSTTAANSGTSSGGKWQDKTAATSGMEPVGLWQDLSGDGNDLLQQSVDNRPFLTPASLNGRTGVEFDGASAFLRSIQSMSFAEPSYVFMVARGFWNASGVLFDVSIGTGAFNRLECCAPAVSARLNAGTPGAPITGPASGVAGAARICFNGASSFVQVNNLPPVACSPGSGAPNAPLTLGAQLGGSNPIALTVWELIVVPASAITEGEQLALMNYLNARYNLW